MTELEQNMEMVWSIFRKYGSKDSSGWSLNKKQLKTLVETQFPSFVQAQNNPNFVDKLMKDLDEDKTDKVNLEQFMRLFVGLLLACERCQTLSEQRAGK